MTQTRRIINMQLRTDTFDDDGKLVRYTVEYVTEDTLRDILYPDGAGLTEPLTLTQTIRSTAGMVVSNDPNYAHQSSDPIHLVSLSEVRADWSGGTIYGASSDSGDYLFAQAIAGGAQTVGISMGGDMSLIGYISAHNISASYITSDTALNAYDVNISNSAVIGFLEVVNGANIGGVTNFNAIDVSFSIKLPQFTLATLPYGPVSGWILCVSDPSPLMSGLCYLGADLVFYEIPAGTTHQPV